MVKVIPGIPNLFSDLGSDGQVLKKYGKRKIPSDDDDTVSTKKPDEIVVDAAGNGDFKTIAAGLTELGASAGTIRVLAGIYPITSTLTLGANQTIFGSGYGTNITTTSDITLVNLNGNRSSIFMCRVDGNSTGSSQLGITVGGDECVIRNCWITQIGDIGINIEDGSDRVVIEGCVIKDCGDRCLHLLGDKFMVSDCVIENSADDGIAMTSADFGSIIGNKITSHGEHGIDMVSCSQTCIVGNYIYSNGDNNNNGTGIDMGPSCNDTCVTGNILHTNDGYGINVSGSATVLVGNSILNNEDGGINDTGVGTVSTGNAVP